MAFESLKGKLDVGVHMLCVCIVFIFLVTSAPISQFKGKGVLQSGASKVTCVTVWGLKNDCSNNGYDYQLSSLNCDKPKQLMQAAEAFYIISVVVSLIEFVLAGMFFIGFRTRIALIVLAVFEIALALIPWVMMTVVWTNNFCDDIAVPMNVTDGKVTGIPVGKQLRDNFKRSAGYGLTITAWAMQIISVAALLLIK